MGRKVRMVPADWQHPKNEAGRYKPMFDEPYQTALDEWVDEYLKWRAGSHQDPEAYKYMDDETRREYASRPPAETFVAWSGDAPDAAYYRPDWPAETRTHLQMYETCSEGTPISPVMETPEALARWLADNEASAFGHMTASYEAWLRVCRGGYAPGMVMAGPVMMSGVQAGAELGLSGADASTPNNSVVWPRSPSDTEG